MRKIMLLPVTAVLLSGQSTPPQDVPLPHKGPWVAEFEENMCVLSRAYVGAKGKPLRIAFRPLPQGDDMEIITLFPTSRQIPYSTGKGRIELWPSGDTAEVSVNYYTTVKEKMLITRFQVSNDDVSGLEAAKSIRLVAPRVSQTYHLSLTGMSKAMTTIRECQDDLVKSWGYDPVSLRSLTRTASPIGAPQSWFVDSDYPSSASMLGISGVSRLRFTVTAAGKVENCKIITGSGSELLDDRGCEVLTRRARYEPALDAAGQAVRSLKSVTINWRAW